jgi:predicted O-linked N-acetylglucosamine transferase (SPINDLY family)
VTVGKVRRRGRLLGDYRATSGSIDPGLGTFSDNGHTTSLDALGMGVPG